MLSVFKKKSLASLLATFVTLIADLRKLADAKVAEAQKNELKAQQIIDLAKADAIATLSKANAKAAELMNKVETAEVEAEEALAAADSIEAMIGGSAVLEAAADNL